jgi:hypothetical protein
MICEFEKDFEGDDHGRPPSGGTAKYRKSSVSKPNVPDAIRNKHLPKTRQEHYQWAKQFGTHAFKNSSIFWDIAPCCPLKVNRRFGITSRLLLKCRRISETELLACLMLASCLVYSPTLKTEATCLRNICRLSQTTKQSYNPEDGTLHNHGCEHMKSYTCI